MKVLIINGPNLNFLGIRETSVYGSMTLSEINSIIDRKCNAFGIEAQFFQSNHEGEIVDKIQESYNKIDYLIINPGAFTHYSIAIRDAILAVGVKTIEVHLSNVYAREEFRKTSVISDISIGKIIGFNYFGYLMALDYIVNYENLN